MDERSISVYGVHNKKKDPDIKIKGNGEIWRFIAKVENKKEKITEITKAMEISGSGVMVYVITEINGNFYTTSSFIPNSHIVTDYNTGISTIIGNPQFKNKYWVWVFLRLFIIV